MSSKPKAPKRTMHRPVIKKPPTVLPIPEVLPDFGWGIAVMIGPRTVHVFRDHTDMDPAWIVRLHALASDHEAFHHIDSNLRVKFASRMFLAEFVLASQSQSPEENRGRLKLLASAFAEIASW